MARTLRTKDQTIQESTVKIQLMERRLETVKKQADAIVELENELIKARKQERTYEEAMEQLHSDLDALEQDNAKLKTLTAGQERQSACICCKTGYKLLTRCLAPGPQQVELENAPVEGSLETFQLFEQVWLIVGIGFHCNSCTLARLRPCVGLYVSFGQRIPTSKVMTFCEKSKLFLPFLNGHHALKLLHS